MEALSYLRLAGVFVLSIIASRAFTQEVDLKQPILMTSKAKPVSVKRHLWEDFNASFKNAKDVTWFWTGKHYVANFLVEEHNHSAMFKPEGTLLHHLYFGSETILPSEIRKLVRMCYSEYNIISVVILTTGRKIASFIYLSDKQEVIEIRIEDMRIDELRRYMVKNATKPKFHKKKRTHTH